METQRLQRGRSRRRARKKQIAWLIVIALVVGVGIWTRILIERRKEATMFTLPVAQQKLPEADSAPGPLRVKPTPANASKNLILFIGHGYGIVPMTATRIFNKGESGALAIDEFPETALVRTWSRNAQAGDSAAAMSAYMTGVKVDNEVLSQTNDTRAYDEEGRSYAAHDESSCPTVGNGKAATTLLELAKKSGRAIGIVTTARVTQAIAAASYAHLCQRAGENNIAAQLVPGGLGGNARLGDGVDVILGGGWQHFLPKDDPRGSSRNDTRDLFAEMRAKGYTVIGRQAELTAIGTKSAAGGKLLGLFDRSAMGFEADRLGTNDPGLVEMTTRAIDLLARNPNGYLLIVEGGRIGDALDTSLGKKALQDALAFDDAIAAALVKISLVDPDLTNSTVVVTADHDQTMIMNGVSTLTGRTLEARPSVLGLLRNYSEPTQFAMDATGRPFTTMVFGAGDKRVKGPRSQSPALNDLVVADKSYRYEATIEVAGAIGGTDVMLFAIGGNASRFHGTIDNTQVYALMRAALGL